jgi:hypothetical protein
MTSAARAGNRHGEDNEKTSTSAAARVAHQIMRMHMAELPSQQPASD